MAPERSFGYRAGAAPTVEPEDVNLPRQRHPNRISSRRFTLLSWLPKSLFVQFQRSANIYFLIVSVLVCFSWSPTFWPSTVLPFAAVLLWTALKDLYEDMRRKRDDDTENMRLCWRYDFLSQKFVRTRWDLVLCGDVLLSLQDDSFPADMAIIGAHQGQAFISTANLDGETNLKERRAADICSVLLETDEVAEAERAASSEVQEATKTAEADDGTEDSSEMMARRKVAEALVQLVLKQGLEACFEAPKVGPNEMRGTMELKTPGQDVKMALAQLQVAQPSTLISDHFVPRGCVLRNTPWLVSVVAYAGDDTQAWLSLTEVKAKISNLQVHLNYCVLGLVATLVVFCVHSAIMAQALNAGSKGADFPKDLAKYWIILYQIVPISLYVCFEIMKLMLGFQINIDKQMVDPQSGKSAMARTADLVEEMGQVRHVFSDKTGTLTQNEMRFARCFVGGKDLGEFRSDVAARKSRGSSSRNQPSNGNGSTVVQTTAGSATAAETDTTRLNMSRSASLPFENDPVPSDEGPAPGMLEVKRVIQDESDPLCQECRRFFLCLTVCHDAQVECKSAGAPIFSGSSPDEVAFLEAAHEVGMTLYSRKAASGNASAACLQIDAPHGSQELTVLCTAPFTSDRKRMTVVCEYNGEYVVFTKGADSVMGPLCAGALDSTAVDQLDFYARQGLRTLVLAWKKLDASVAPEIRKRYEVARSAVDDRERLLREWAAEVESSLTFVGISAIEDRLQQGVPAAISMLKEMGILVWVLTGDKTETAVEIARSCELLGDETPLVALVGATSLEDAKEMMRAAEVRGTGGAAMVLDGSLVKYVLADREMRKKLYGLATASTACVCCRLAPQQKRGLIEMTREHDPTRITLAIGDGANDVAMIQGAHVGVGVRGKEGSQAVQACDVAISQFRFLVVLLQCHGRRAYRRISVFLCYYIYKHVVIAVGSLCWAHESRFDGNVSYPEWLSSAYSVLYTSLPVLVVLGLDCDVPDAIALTRPELYEEGIKRMHFNIMVFVAWMVRGIWHGSLAWFVPSWVLSARKADIDDWGGTFWVCSITAFSLVVIFVNGMLWMISYNPFSPYTIGVLVLSFFLYGLSLLVLGHTAIGDLMQWQMVGTPLEMLTDGGALAALCLTPLALLLDAGGLWAMVYFMPTPLDKLRWHGRMNSLAKVMPGSPKSTPAT